MVENGGWHFSYILKKNEIVKKLKSFAHKEYNNSFFTNKKKIELKIKNNLDIYDRGYVFKKYNIFKLPEYIYKNKKKFNEYLIK